VRRWGSSDLAGRKGTESDDRHSIEDTPASVIQHDLLRSGDHDAEAVGFGGRPACFGQSRTADIVACCHGRGPAWLSAVFAIKQGGVPCHVGRTAVVS
jgi:hypothetical protein